MAGNLIERANDFDGYFSYDIFKNSKGKIIIEILKPYYGGTNNFKKIKIIWNFIKKWDISCLKKVNK